MSKLRRVKRGKSVHLSKGRGNNESLCGASPPFKVVKSKVTCAKCDPSIKEK